MTLTHNGITYEPPVQQAYYNAHQLAQKEAIAIWVMAKKLKSIMKNKKKPLPIFPKGGIISKN